MVSSEEVNKHVCFNTGSTVRYVSFLLQTDGDPRLTITVLSFLHAHNVPVYRGKRK